MGMVALLGDVPDMFAGKLDVGKAMRLIFTVASLSLNLYLQFTVLIYVNRFIVGGAVHNTQQNYKRFHEELFDHNGDFQESTWKTWDGPYMELCNMAETKVAFTVCVVILWVAKMLGEIRTVERLGRDMHAIPSLQKDAQNADMIKEVDGEFHIVALSFSARTSMYLLIMLPKFMIASVLLFIGCRWLAATESFSDLILNALALEFIIGIDELIAETLAPERMREQLEATKMRHLPVGSKSDSDDAWHVAMAYLRSMAYTVLCVAGSFLYIEHFQQVIPNFPNDISKHCTGWFDYYYEPICPFGGSLEKCFPYGPQNMKPPW
eukprot:TRINITY_DN76085_c0_g1_i1.p1 TRINITY_DN76085_c0_g1~~TRINITY_DN76085_c0_g1_i1.p1  ORF type:complete len:376 (-),score=56.94 TRINITY_DN76085_c0_g1_i1:83-1048(-)